MFEPMVFKRILTVALPMIGALLAQVGLEVTDTFMLGQLGYEALASGGLGAAMYVIFIILSVGIFSAVGVEVAKARQDTQEVRAILAAASQLAVLIFPIGFLAAYLIPKVLLFAGQAPEMVARLALFLRWIVLGYPAILVYLIMREYLAAIERTQMILVVSLLCIPVNLLCNYLFMYGIGPLPAMGIKGVALATSIVEWWAVGLLAFYVYRIVGLRFNPVQRFEYKHIKMLLKLGAPVAMTMLLEVFLFSMASFLAGYLGEKSLAIHQIVLQYSTVMIMIPVGLSQAAAVLVAQDEDIRQVKRWIRHFILLVLCASLLTVTLFIIFPGQLVMLFIHEQIHPDLLKHGIALFKIAALFQLVDSLQVLFNGLLRGLKDTFIPMLMNFCSYALLGVGMAYVLAFHYGLGVEGIWLGLAVGVAATFCLLGSRLFWLLQARCLPHACIPCTTKPR